MTDHSSALSGRQREAAANDVRILDAARYTFLENPHAPISVVAERAGVGIGALYRRFRSKEELLQRLCLEGLKQYIVEAESALAETSNPWSSFCRFMQRVVDANTRALTIRFAGIFPATEELYRLAETGQKLNRRIFARAKAAGAIRNDLKVDDLSFIFEQLAAVEVADERRSRELRQRYLQLFLDGIHSKTSKALPTPAPTWAEIQRKWTA